MKAGLEPEVAVTPPLSALKAEAADCFETCAVVVRVHCMGAVVERFVSGVGSRMSARLNDRFADMSQGFLVISQA